MALSPQNIRQTTFKSVRKGYDPSQVDTFVKEVAAALEAAQNDATAMEARARAAVARLQELSQQQEAAPEAPTPKVDEAETISRTLLLAQRTADTTIAEAQAEADRLLAAARDDAASALDQARAEAAAIVEAAKAEARRAGEAERVRVEGEVQALLARRDFLVSDVDHLEQYLVAQRERIIEAVGALNDLVQRVPAGLGDMRRPLLSAAADPDPAPDADAAAPSADGPADAGSAAEPDTVAADPDGHDEIAEITRVAAESADPSAEADTADTADTSDTLFDEGGEPTQPIATVEREP
jgi:DivIVA domain-containing protein